MRRSYSIVPLMVTLREIRETRGLSQDDLHTLSGVAKRTIGQLELGRRKPRPSTRRRLARALKVRPQDIEFTLDKDRPH